ncbi:MAG: hypothetical protein AB2805_03215, partial [Candidatus Thiodiazotropha sp.]
DHLQGFYGHLNLQDFQLLNAEHNQPFVALYSRPRIPGALDNAEKQISCHSNKKVLQYRSQAVPSPITKS